MSRTRRRGALTAAAVMVALTGCGAQATRHDEPRPPAPIVLSASISDERISVSPHAFGAGPVSIVVTNGTRTAQQLTLESADAVGQGPGLRQETAPISPRDTATLKADVAPGRYRVHVGGEGILAATLRVGPMRPSAQNDLLQP